MGCKPSKSEKEEEVEMAGTRKEPKPESQPQVEVQSPQVEEQKRETEEYKKPETEEQEKQEQQKQEQQEQEQQKQEIEEEQEEEQKQSEIEEAKPETEVVVPVKKFANIKIMNLVNSFSQSSDEKSWIEQTLENVEWQVPERTPEETEMMEQIELVTATLGDDCKPLYDLTLKSLWKNWIDALESGLQKLSKFQIDDEQKKLDIQFMNHKLNFTRIRQELVAIVHIYLKDNDFNKLKEEANKLVIRCQELAQEQPEDIFSALPGIIPKRDTMMLEGRIEDLMKKIQAHGATQ